VVTQNQKHFTADQCAAQSAPLAPIASYRYFDKIHVWLPKPLNRKQLREIADECERGSPDALIPHYEPCPYHPDYPMRLDLHQASRQAFKVLARIMANSSNKPPLINYAEITWDLIFNEQSEADDCVQYFLNHLVQGWHRKSMRVAAFYKWKEDDDGFEYFRDYPVGWTTRSIRTGKRGLMGHWFSGYSTRPCKLTGETGCCHVEARYSSLRSVKRIGIVNLSDLIHFDFNGYFDTHLKLYNLDEARLGRLHRNQQSGGKSRHSSVEHYGNSGFTYNRDLRLGATLYNSLSLHNDPFQDERSLQHFLNQYPKARRLLTPTSPIEIQHVYHISRNTLVPVTS